MSHDAGSNWRPVATRATLEIRARLLAQTRAFFADRGVLEVDTPCLVNAPVTDVHIHSAEVRLELTENPADLRRCFLHTSPEYAMKRLLAAGSGDIYQICHVFRAREANSRLHSPEFTLVEWYRLGFTLEELMEEVGELVQKLLDLVPADLRPERRPVEHVRYSDLFARELGIDPLSASLGTLQRLARDAGLDASGAGSSDRDALLDFLMGTRVGPGLGKRRLTFVCGYPASQAALAELDPIDPRNALRFELYADGIELANGFSELRSEAEQRQRFIADQIARAQCGLEVWPLDERLLAALASGLPPVAGVALGFDRVLMITTGAERIQDVCPFPFERA